MSGPSLAHLQRRYLVARRRQVLILERLQAEAEAACGPGLEADERYDAALAESQELKEAEIAVAIADAEQSAFEDGAR